MLQDPKLSQLAKKIQSDSHNANGVVIAIGKLSGKKAVLEKILTHNYERVSPKIMEIVADSNNLLYLIEKGGNDRITGILKKIEQNGNNNPYAAFGENRIEHIPEGDQNYPGGFHYENSNRRGYVISGTRKLGENEVYQAEVLIDGTVKPTNSGRPTFFPKEWSREKVLDSIIKLHSKKIH